MVARLRSWWQKIKQHSFIATGITIVLLTLIAFIFAAYQFGWSGTGFLNKTLWDWLQLLIIPLALAVVALLFNRATTRTEQQIAAQRYEQDQQIAAQRYEQDQQIALDKQHEDLLQAYLDRISELLLKESLRTSSSEEVRNVARVRTITVLTQLDARRVGYVFAFLREAGLMSTKSNDNVVSLRGADLRGVQWRLADLSGANLSGANLGWTNRLTDLSGANLSEANLSEAYLLGTNLLRATLRDADLSKAFLISANLEGANLSGANLFQTTLYAANLSKADLSNANLSEVNLQGANLQGAKVAPEQLDQAKYLRDATMPDGTKHDTQSMREDIVRLLQQASSPDKLDLSGRDLVEVDLSGLDLHNANLSKAFLSNANLEGANLEGAKVTQKQLQEVQSLQGATMPNGRKHP